MKGFIGLNYEKHPEASKAITNVIKDKLDMIINKNEVSQDWVEIIIYYTSNKYTESREDVKKELAELLGVA
jgi:hypothetical protein